MVKYLIEFGLMVGFIWFVFSQMILPAILGTESFPLFRSKQQAKLLKELEVANQIKKEKELENQIENTLSS